MGEMWVRVGEGGTGWHWVWVGVGGCGWVWARCGRGVVVDHEVWARCGRGVGEVWARCGRGGCGWVKWVKCVCVWVGVGGCGQMGLCELGWVGASWVCGWVWVGVGECG